MGSESWRISGEASEASVLERRLACALDTGVHILLRTSIDDWGEKSERGGGKLGKLMKGKRLLDRLSSLASKSKFSPRSHVYGEIKPALAIVACETLLILAE